MAINLFSRASAVSRTDSLNNISAHAQSLGLQAWCMPGVCAVKSPGSFQEKPEQKASG